MRRIILLIFLILLSVSLVHGGDSGIENIFDYGAGARAMGLGNSYTAVADDSSSIYWNPGGLGMLNYNEIMLLHTSLFYDTYYNFFTFSYPTLRMGVIGLGLFRIGTGDIIFRDSNNIITSEGVSSEEYQFLIGYGLKLDLPFSFGAAIKINTHEIGQYSGINVSFDFGVLILTYGPSWRQIFGDYYLKNFKVGINVKNFYSTPTKLLSYPERDQLNIKTGLSYYYYLDSNLDHKILATFDMNFYKDKEFKINTGLEYNLYKMAFLRAGYDQNIGLVIGGGIKYWDIRLDYSIAFQEISLTHRISALWQFGESMEEKRKEEKEKISKEAESKIKDAVKEETVKYQEKIAGLEKEHKEKIQQLEEAHKTNTQKIVDELNQKYEQDKEKVIQEFKQESEKEKYKMISALSNRYEKEKKELLSTVSKKYKKEKAALVNRMKKDFKREKSLLTRKLIADEKFIREHYSKGIELFEKGDVDGAIAEFGTVIKFNPNHLEAERYLKRAKASKRDAGTYSKEIMDIYNKGIDYYVEGEYKKAIKEWQKILKIDSYNKLAIRNINDAEKKLRELEKLKKGKK